uniref:Endonuclease/exonuclease/phosphatase domain-containing protein n=1 Tax=Sciurus vulgaris TaxID=55149 RepID=A0A8D2DC48_SCIVU
MRWEKTYHAHGHSKKAGVSILISDNVDFKPKLVRRDKEGHYILLKGSINQQGITIINIYAPNIGSSMYVKQILLNSRNEIDHNTIILGDFNTPLSPLDRSSKQKLNKETIDLNNMWWPAPVIPATGEAKAGESLESRNSSHPHGVWGQRGESRRL